MTVIGLGYVGLPVAAKFAEAGLDVTGVDIVPEKVAKINAGESTIEGLEPGLSELIRQVVQAGRLRASTRYDAIQSSDFVLIVVETPIRLSDRGPHYAALRSAAKSVGENLRRGTLVVIESTTAPGTTSNIVKPLLESESGMKAGTDFLLATAPERVMPGKLIYNLVNLDRVVGGIDEKSTQAAVQLYKRVVKATIYPTDALTAEVVKTTENAYRDVQIAFANEIALLCENMHVDVHSVRELVNRTPDRNMHLPGAGVGGHCLPKDSWLLAFGAKGKNEPRLIALAREINDGMPLHMSELCEETLSRAGRRVYGSKVTILGAAYLEDSDDTRNSPAFPLMNALEVIGAEVVVHDPFAHKSDAVHPVRDLDAALRNSDCIAVVTAHKVYRSIDLEHVGSLMRTRTIVDGRRLYDWKECIRKGFIYCGIGQGCHLPRNP